MRNGSALPRLRHIIEALRFGLVPAHGLPRLTLRFDEMSAWIESRLPHRCQDSPQISEVIGPFGHGKSHMMALIRYVAEMHGYVTARVEVDGNSVTLSQPEKFLFHLWNTLSIPKAASSTPLLSLNLQALERGEPTPPMPRIADNYTTIQHLKRRGVLEKYETELEAVLSSSDEFTASEVNGCLMRDPHVSASCVAIKRLIGLKVDERPEDFVRALAGVAHIAKAAGFRGLVVTIDEFEVERALLTEQKLQRTVQLLVALTQYMGGASSIPRTPLSMFIATVRQGESVGDPIVDYLVDNAGGQYYPLQPFNPEEQLRLAERIHHLYCEAYGLDSEYSRDMAIDVQRDLRSEGRDRADLIRAFIKSYVMSLDGLYGPSTPGA